jgi:hypothetical protein
MAADDEGNDVTAVGIPVTGFVGIAPVATTIPTPVEGGADDYVLPGAFQKVGLIKVDGGPQWSWAADGDPLEFWQDGYTIPTGLANVTVEFSAAQTDDFVRSIVYGKTPDANGFITVDGGGHSVQWVLFTEEIFKNGAIRRRVAPVANLLSIAEDQSTRGDVLGYDITLNINRTPLLGNEHFGEWLLLPSSGS